MSARDLMTYREPQTGPGTVVPGWLGRILLEDPLEIFRRNTGAAVTHFYPEGIFIDGDRFPAIGKLDAFGHLRIPAVPKNRISPNFNFPFPGREAAGIIEQVDERLLDLYLVDKQLLARRTHLHPKLDIFRLEHRLHLVDRLRDTGLNVALAPRRSARRLRSDTHLEHASGP